ncbi:MAG: hypothetical protein AB2705_22275 [Candidatus Thiodiazotropha sp.]
MVNQTNFTLWLLGDFNLPKADWELMIGKPDCSFPTFYRECLEAFNDCLFEQNPTLPNRGQNLDLIFIKISISQLIMLTDELDKNMKTGF